VDKAKGVARWRYEAGSEGARPGFHGDALVSDDLIILGSDGPRDDSPGHVYALERATGKLRWSYTAEGGVATDIVRDGERLFAVSSRGELLCLELASGGLAWRFASGPPRRPATVVSATPSLAGGRVFFGALDGHAYALDARSGRSLWKRDLGAAVWTPALALGNVVYLSASDGRVRCLNADSGEPVGELNLAGIPFGPLTPAGDRLLLLVAPDDRGTILKALAPSLAAVSWSREASAGRWTSARPCPWRGGVLVGGETGELAAISPLDGSVRWSAALQGTIRGIGTETGVLYVGTLQGDLYAFVPDESDAQSLPPLPLNWSASSAKSTLKLVRLP
jgi:outer membrane protein assembly factor BamB